MTYAEALFDVCRASEHIVVFHPGLRRTNFYFQQLRGISLVREMIRNGLVSQHRRELIVVGAGVAGLTVSAAALTAGLGVRLVEHDGSFDQYREASHRELHPNLIAWPFQRLRAMTDLPFLNWTCGPASSVVQQITHQWKADFSPHVTSVKSRALGVTESGDGVELECADGGKLLAHAAVIATGFAAENGLGGFRSPSYWTHHDFDGVGDVVVSGSGDGGLIDSAYQVFGSRTVAATRALAYMLESKVHKENIEKAESDAQQVLESGDQEQARRELASFYARFSLEDQDLQALSQLRTRRPLRARLYHQESGAFEPTAAPINKALVSALMNSQPPEIITRKATLRASGDFQRAEGTVEAVADDGSIEPLPIDRLLLRHGAKAALLPLLSGATQRKLSSADKATLTRIVPDEFDREFFVRKAKRKLSPSRTSRPEIHLERCEAQLREMLNYVKLPGEVLQLQSSSSRAWSVIAPVGVRRDLKALFPINTSGLNVQLTESSPRRFEGLG